MFTQQGRNLCRPCNTSRLFNPQHREAIRRMRDLRAAETAISVGRVSTDDVTRYSQGAHQARETPTLETYQIHILEKKAQRLDGHDFTVVRLLSRDREYLALEKIALEISLGHARLQDYIARCHFHALEMSTMQAYVTGTLLYAQAVKNLHEEAMAYAKEGPDFDYVESKDEQQQQQCTAQPSAKGDSIELPPAMVHHHAEQVDYAARTGKEVVHAPYPDLNEAWEELFQRWLENPDLKIRPSAKVRIPAHAPLNTETRRVYHEEYGWDGYSYNPTKKDCDVTQFPTPLAVDSTYSTAVAPHHKLFLPRYNRKSRWNAAHGMVQRLNRDPAVDQVCMDAMEPYIKRAVSRIIEILSSLGLTVRRDAITPRVFMQWLATRRFPAAKKIRYLQEVRPFVIDENTWVDASLFPVDPGAFLKNEYYASGKKGPRQILPGPYAMAGVMGPLCDIIGDYFFSTQFTSKKIPETARPGVAIARFGDGPVILNDMSAFECSITARHQELIEHRIFKHFFPAAAPWVDRYRERIAIVTHGMNANLPSLRRSGDPQTSLGNSLTNLASIFAATYYMADRHGLRLYEPVSWVEGDDSLVAWNNEWGNDFNSRRNRFFSDYRSAFLAMGFETKMSVSGFAGDAGYCSMYFTHKGVNSPSVASTLIDFPYDHNNSGQGLELLAMKSQSLSSQAPGQPVTWALAAHYAARQTTRLRLAYNAYEHEEYLREGFNVIVDRATMVVTLAPRDIRQPDDDDRVLFQGRYGFTPDQQRGIEQRILAKGLLGVTKKEMRQFCELDDIDYDCAARFYARNVERCDSYPKPDNDPVERHFVHDPQTGSWRIDEQQQRISGLVGRPVTYKQYLNDRIARLRNPILQREKEVSRIEKRERELRVDPAYWDAEVYGSWGLLDTATGALLRAADTLTGWFRRRPKGASAN